MACTLLEEEEERTMYIQKMYTEKTILSVYKLHDMPSTVQYFTFLLHTYLEYLLFYAKFQTLYLLQVEQLV